MKTKFNATRLYDVKMVKMKIVQNLGQIIYNLSSFKVNTAPETLWLIFGRF